MIRALWRCRAINLGQVTAQLIPDVHPRCRVWCHLLSSTQNITRLNAQINAMPSRSHLKSEAMEKFTNDLRPIEEAPATSAPKNAMRLCPQ